MSYVVEPMTLPDDAAFIEAERVTASRLPIIAVL
jgi:hypothetical protein